MLTHYLAHSLNKRWEEVKYIPSEDEDDNKVV